MAARAARIASPIGLASLGLEGVYQGGKFAKKRIEENKILKTDKLKEILRLEEDQIKKIKNTYTYDYFTEKDKYDKFYNVVSENKKRFLKYCSYV